MAYLILRSRSVFSIICILIYSFAFYLFLTFLKYFVFINNIIIIHTYIHRYLGITFIKYKRARHVTKLYSRLIECIQQLSYVPIIYNVNIVAVIKIHCLIDYVQSYRTLNDFQGITYCLADYFF